MTNEERLAAWRKYKDDRWYENLTYDHKQGFLAGYDCCSKSRQFEIDELKAQLAERDRRVAELEEKIDLLIKKLNLLSLQVETLEECNEKLIDMS